MCIIPMHVFFIQQYFLLIDTQLILIQYFVFLVYIQHSDSDFLFILFGSIHFIQGLWGRVEGLGEQWDPMSSWPLTPSLTVTQSSMDYYFQIFSKYSCTVWPQRFRRAAISPYEKATSLVNLLKMGGRHLLSLPRLDLKSWVLKGKIQLLGKFIPSCTG